MPRNIALVLSYDGTDFSGFQIQKNGRSVQEEVETALAKLQGRPVRIKAAGRTDAGVHAVGQVVNFESDISSLPSERYALALNALLPRDVRALRSREVSLSFHARKDALSREYRYYLLPQQPGYPFYLRYSLQLKTMPDLGLLNSLAAPIVGVHDFETFTAAGDPSFSRVREVFSASFFMQPPFLVFKVRGNAFLWRMVRSLLGTILELERRGASSGEMEGLLSSKKRENAGATVPPTGLFLHEVAYGPEFGI